jgi:transcription antitermination factor NusG
VLSSAGSKNKWVVVGLSAAGERETNLSAIANAVKRILGCDVEVFVPAVSQQARDESHTAVYMDGYIFVKYRDNVSFIKLQDTMYFGQVLCCKVRGGAVDYSLVDDRVLDPLRKGVKNLSVCKFSAGDSVRVTRGEFKNLRGVVRLIHEGGETVLVDVSQRSKPMLIDFPVIYLQVVDP